MSSPESAPDATTRFAARVTDLLRKPDRSPEAISALDPATIALIITVVRLVLIWIQRRRAREVRNWAVSLRAPRRWQFLCIQRRTRLLDAVQKRIASQASSTGQNPSELLDAVLETVVDSPDAEIESLTKEILL
jgi:hypothetical protein